MPQDVRGPLGEVMAARAMFASRSKHVFFCQTDATVARTQFDMARVVLAGKELAKHPIMTSLVDPTTPLSWEKGPVETLIENARAGTLVVQNAEILSGVLISQLVNRGSPVIYGSASLILDMHQAKAVLGTPESVTATLHRYASKPKQERGRLTFHSRN